MQLSSFLGQLAKMLETQSTTVRSMQEALDDISEGKVSDERLLALGAFISWSILETDWAVAQAGEMVNQALAPLGLEPMPEGHIPRFQPTPMTDLTQALPVILERNQGRVQQIREIEAELLALPGEDLLASYPQQSLHDLASSWERQLQDFFRE